MVEKFSDFEGKEYLKEEGTFVFTIDNYTLTESKSGNVMAVFEVSSDHGSTKIYHVLDKKARWSYNKLIKACLNLNTPEKIAAFECDYETIGRELVGKTFKGVVTADCYEKEVKVLNDEGTYDTTTKLVDSYKITDYEL